MSSKYTGTLFGSTNNKKEILEKKKDTTLIELHTKLLYERYNKECFSAKDLMKILNVGETNIYQLLNSGKLNVLKIGNRKVVPLISLAEFMINSK